MFSKEARLTTPARFGLLAAGVGAAAIAARTWRRRARLINFADRVVVITGGSRGLGFALAQEFARRGAHLVICGRDTSILQEAEIRLAGMGVQVLARSCDISKRSDAESLIQQAQQGAAPTLWSRLFFCWNLSCT